MARYLPYLAAILAALGCEHKVAGQGTAATILPSDTSVLLRPVGEPEPSQVALREPDPSATSPSSLAVGE